MCLLTKLDFSTNYIAFLVFLQILFHIKEQCPLTLIPCPYAQIGCTTKVILLTMYLSCQ